MTQNLSAERISEALNRLANGWYFNENRLINTFTFTSFVEAFTFMTAVAIEAEKVNHHPKWENDYNKVSIALTTHDSGGVTQKDFDLARSIDTCYSRYIT